MRAVRSAITDTASAPRIHMSKPAVSPPARCLAAHAVPQCTQGHRRSVAILMTFAATMVTLHSAKRMVRHRNPAMRARACPAKEPDRWCGSAVACLREMPLDLTARFPWYRLDQLAVPGQMITRASAGNGRISGPIDTRPCQRDRNGMAIGSVMPSSKAGLSTSTW